jgi:anaerobic magnesium-protoporphyrin IX monomethyl ester cyclase
MKICLVRCPAPFLIDDRMFPPLGLMAVGTGLRQAGHDVSIHDGPLQALPLDQDAYGFGPTAPEYPLAIETLNRIKRTNRTARVVLGGPHATLNWSTCLKEGWDCVVVGDGEIVSDRAFIGKPTLLMAEERPLDEYPIIDRSLVDLRTYHYKSNGVPGTTLVTARGCPHQCDFCCKNHDRVRLMTAPRAIAEIRYLAVDWGYKVLAFPEDIFILDRKRTETICAALKDLGIEWRCLVRSDIVVRRGMDFLTMLKDAGCAAVGIGIESGSEQILQTIHKGETVSTILQSVRMLQAAGIRTRGFFVVGLPGETPETLEETWRFLEEAQLDEIDAKIFQPYPGSPIYEHRDRYDIKWNGTAMDKTFYKGKPGLYEGSIATAALTTEQIVEAWKAIETRFNPRVTQ